MVFSFLLGANVLVEKVFAARHRLLRGRGADRVDAGAGFMLTIAIMYVRSICDQHSLRRHRPARELEG
jgi:hypothetical protein